MKITDHRPVRGGGRFYALFLQFRMYDLHVLNIHVVNGLEPKNRWKTLYKYVILAFKYFVYKRGTSMGLLPMAIRCGAYEH